MPTFLPNLRLMRPFSLRIITKDVYALYFLIVIHGVFFPKYSWMHHLLTRLVKRQIFKIGDNVRLTHLRNPFSREYDEGWMGEIFSISGKNLRGGICLPIEYRILMKMQ